MKTIGLYLHIPFCRSKCPYCDFYSLTRSEPLFRTYAHRMAEQLERLSKQHPAQADTLYLGGGTPSLIGGDLLAEIIRAAQKHFALLPETEVTVECNPSSCSPDLFRRLAEAGVNRISLGMQSAVDGERKKLGRRSGKEEVARCIEWAHGAGIDNLSLDLMLGVPGQTAQSAVESVSFCAEMGVAHVSGYLLKIEEGTPFHSRAASLALPDEDETCRIYEVVCRELEKSGFMQYEISNFARPGYESRHNLKYWNDEEYLGIGPAAHSFVDGRRFYYPRDIGAFLNGVEPVDDGSGGDFEEYAMLRLRLCGGLREQDVRARFGHPIPPEFYERACDLVKGGLAVRDEGGIRLTRAGFLLSNSAIATLLYG